MNAGTPGLRIHTSPRLIRQVRDRDQQRFPRRKPLGLWWGYGPAWAEYVLALRRRVPGAVLGKYAYRVDLAPDARILTLSTWTEVLAFTGEYGRSVQHARDGAPHDRTIDWTAVAQRYDGIEIPNLHRALRQHPHPPRLPC